MNGIAYKFQVYIKEKNLDMSLKDEGIYDLLYIHKGIKTLNDS